MKLLNVLACAKLSLQEDGCCPETKDTKKKDQQTVFCHLIPTSLKKFELFWTFWISSILPCLISSSVLFVM